MKKTRKVLTLFITPHILLPDTPAPDWPQLDANDHKIQPIMTETPSQNYGTRSKD